MEEYMIFGEDNSNWIDTTSKIGRGLNPVVDEYVEPEVGKN